MKRSFFVVALLAGCFGAVLSQQIDPRFGQAFTLPQSSFPSFFNQEQQCVTPTSQTGTCIPLLQCPSLSGLLRRKPLSTQDRQYLARSQCGWNYQLNQPAVCCADRAGPAPRPTPAPTPTGPTATGGRALLPDPGVCGLDYDDRIYGGERTKIDEYPWLVLIEYSKPNNGKGFHCGGVLINERYVLTASHCVNGKDLPPTWSLSGVRLGEWDTQTAPDCDTSTVGGSDCAPMHIDVPVEQKIPHPDYDPNNRNQFNDIALLRLSRSVTYSDFVKPVCLPLDQTLRSRSFVGESFDVAGWGKTETRSASNVKLKVRVDGSSTESCNTVYRRENVQITDKQLCAGGEKGKDSCRGDSGGPLMGTYRTADGKPYTYLAGLVSYGPSPCGLEGWPGVYTRLTEYTDWITQTIRP